MLHAVTADGGPGHARHAPTLAGYHADIAKRLAELRSARGSRPVYGLEHGLCGADVERMNRLVGMEIRDRGLGTNFSGCYLALVAVASEVGYGYRGTGTDFWPRFEAVLGARIAEQEHAAVSRLFETAHRIDGIRKPVDSAWARAFRHIAWPIGNAVAPKEIHRGLAAALREAYRLGGDVSDEDVLVRRLRSIAGRVASPRLVRWLEDADLAAAVAWRLLDQPDPQARIVDDTLERIFSDLSADAVARKAVASASALHHRRAQSVAKKQGHAGRARLMIREHDSGADLLAVLPYLAGKDRDEMRMALARAGVRPRLWGSVGPVEPDALFSGIPLALGDVDLNRLCEDMPPFIPVIATIPGEVAEAFSRLAPDLSQPIILVPTGVPSQFVQTKTRSIPDGLFRLLICRLGELPAQVTHKGMVGGLTCIEIDRRDSQVTAWLERLGLMRDHGPAIEFGGALSLGQNLHGPVFPEDQTVLIRVTGAPTDRPTVLTMRGLPPVELRNGQIAAVREILPGEYTIEIDAGGEKLRAGFTVVSAEPAAAVLDVSLEPPAPTADDVVESRLALHVRFALPLRGVEVVVTASAGGHPVASAAERVDTWPASFSPNSKLMLSLAEQLRKAGANRDWQLELAVRIGGAWTRRWSLGWELRHCDWESVDGEWRALTEDRELDIELTSGSSPLGCVLPLDDKGAPILRVPFLDGAPLPTEGLCTAPASMLLGGFAISVPDRIMRESDSRDNAPGVLATIASWLAWASAKPEHIVADIGRRRVASRVEQFAVAQLCGNEWAELEKANLPLSTDFWSALSHVAMKRGLAEGGMLPDIASVDRPRIRQLVANALERAAPQLAEYGPDEYAEKLAGDLDMAVIEAYEELGQLQIAEGRSPIEDPDTNSAPEAWLAAIGEAEGRHRAAGLGQLILPRDRARQLMRVDYRHLTDRDVLALLIESHLDLQLRPPNWLGAAAIETSLAIWIDPRSVAGRADWKEHIRRLVADRQSARAARYAALRFRAARGAEAAG